MTDPAPELDRLLSDPTRLTIMAVLGATSWCSFAFLRESTALSDSALSKQLTTLRTSEFIEMKRTYTGRLHKTTVCATEHGRHRFLGHVTALQALVDRARQPRPSGQDTVSPSAP